MFLTGFADEASADFDTQIRATLELGWNRIEARMIGTKMLGTMSDAEFDSVREKLNRSGVCINCYGSAVANWSRHPRREADFEAGRQELLTALPRMKLLGIKLIRGMSFLTPDDETPDAPELEQIIFRKIREYVRICADFDVVYGHENCMNYGGLSHLHTLKLIEQVNSDYFKLIFDTGNPVFNPRHIGVPPYPPQSAWEFYCAVREHIVHVHIKDAVSVGPSGNGRFEARYTWPGYGCGDIRAIVTDLKQSGYDGGFSIEPHVATVFHASAGSGAEKDVRRYQSYIEYGKRFQKLLSECGWDTTQEN